MTVPRAGGAGDAYQQIIDRAMRDSNFRTRLLENPQVAIAEELGTSISSTTTIRVIEEQPNEVVLVLPARSIDPGTMLSDEELEQAAGGLSVSTCATLCSC
jgi:hypothetical protein